jgi:DNA (cytosine-5)-methyltransferase 1
MRKYRLLDLFCGAGGAAMGYHRAGFEVVGVDIKPQPHYPFEFHQADALTYPLEGFDACHASPPCQYYTRLRHLPWLKGRVYWRSVPPVISIFQKLTKPWVIENVEDCWDMPDSVIICGASLGLSLYRHRRILTNFPLLQYPHQKHKFVIEAGRAALAKRHHGTQGFIRENNRNTIAGHHGNTAKSREVMGIDWMNQLELSQAIPPAYTEYIGKYLMQAVSDYEELNGFATSSPQAGDRIGLMNEIKFSVEVR